MKNPETEAETEIDVIEPETPDEGFLQRHEIMVGVGSAVIGGIIALALVYLEPDIPAVSQTNNDESTGIVHTGIGDVQVYEGLSKEHYEALLSQLDEFSESHASKQRLLHNLLSQIDLKNSTISDLSEQVEQSKRRIKALLIDESISEEIKILVRDGRLIEAERLVDSHHEIVLIEEQKLGATYYERGSIKELKRKFVDAQKNYEKAALFQPNNPQHLNQAGLINTKLKNYNRAINYFEQALEIVMQRQEEPYVNAPSSCNNLSESWIEAAGEKLVTSSYLQDSEDTQETSPDIITLCNNLGNAWNAVGDYDKAINYYKRSLKSGVQTLANTTLLSPETTPISAKYYNPEETSNRPSTISNKLWISMSNFMTSNIMKSQQFTII